MAENTPEGAPNFIELASDITIAWLQNPNVTPGADDVPAFLHKMHAAIVGLDKQSEPEPEAVTYEPAVSVRSSVKPDHLVSLIDGKKYKTLKRHLATNGLTPDEYRARYGLKSDYPMVAESYTAQRRDIAQKLGLGRKPVAQAEISPEVLPEPVVEAPAVSPTKPKRASAKSKVAVSGGSVTVPAAAPEAVAPAKPKRAARKSVAAEPAADVAAEAVGDAAVVASPVEGPAKTKRPAAPKTASAKSKPASKEKSAKAPARMPRGKKAAADSGETAASDA